MNSQRRDYHDSKTYRRSRLLRAFAGFTLFVFTVSNTLWASPTAPQGAAPSEAVSWQMPEELIIPVNLGRIESFHRATSGEKPFVVLIQDAHAVVEAQQKIKDLIDYLGKNYGIRLVALEGAEGNLDPLLLKTFPDQTVKERVFNGYLDRGEITGAGLAAVAGRDEKSFYGIETWELYEGNYFAYLRASQVREKIEKELGRLIREADARRKSVFSPKLDEFHENVSKFRTEEIQLLELAQYLRQARFIFSEKEKEHYPQLAAFFEAVRFEDSRDKAGLNVSLRKITRDFRNRELSRLPLERQKDFNNHYQAFLNNRTDEASFLRFLHGLAQDMGIELPLTPIMKTVLSRAEVLSTLRGLRFHSELMGYLDETESRLIRNGEERTLAERYKKIYLLQDLIRLELTRDQLDRYRKAPETYLSLLENTKTEITRALQFYEIALQRDDAFHDRLVDLLTQEKSKAAIFIAGGFHSQGMEEQLKTGGYSYAVISPIIEDLRGHENYAKLMLGGLSYKGYLKDSLYDAFSRHAAQQFISGYDAAQLGRNLKTWRDEIIRTLAARGRVHESGKYTRYIDQLFRQTPGQTAGDLNVQSDAEIKGAIREELENFRANAIDRLDRKLRIQLDNFTNGIRELVSGKRVNAETLASLAKETEGIQTDSVLQITNALFVQNGPESNSLIASILDSSQVPPLRMETEIPLLGKTRDIGAVIRTQAQKMDSLPQLEKLGQQPAVLALAKQLRLEGRLGDTLTNEINPDLAALEGNVGERINNVAASLPPELTSELSREGLAVAVAQAIEEINRDLYEEKDTREIAAPDKPRSDLEERVGLLEQAVLSIQELLRKNQTAPIETPYPSSSVLPVAAPPVLTEGSSVNRSESRGDDFRVDRVNPVRPISRTEFPTRKIGPPELPPQKERKEKEEKPAKAAVPPEAMSVSEFGIAASRAREKLKNMGVDPDSERSLVIPDFASLPQISPPPGALDFAIIAGNFNARQTDDVEKLFDRLKDDGVLVVVNPDFERLKSLKIENFEMSKTANYALFQKTKIRSETRPPAGEAGEGEPEYNEFVLRWFLDESLQNALEISDYRDADGMEVTVIFLEPDETNPFFSLMIRDNGPGFDEEQLRRSARYFYEHFGEFDEGNVSGDKKAVVKILNEEHAAWVAAVKRLIRDDVRPTWKNDFHPFLYRMPAQLGLKGRNAELQNAREKVAELIERVFREKPQLQKDYKNPNGRRLAFQFVSSNVPQEAASQISAIGERTDFAVYRDDINEIAEELRQKSERFQSVYFEGKPGKPPLYASLSYSDQTGRGLFVLDSLIRSSRMGQFSSQNIKTPQTGFEVRLDFDPKLIAHADKVKAFAEAVVNGFKEVRGLRDEVNFIVESRSEVRPDAGRWYAQHVKKGIDVKEVVRRLTAIPTLIYDINHRLQSAEIDRRLKDEDFSEEIISQYANAVAEFNKVVLNGIKDAEGLKAKYLQFHRQLGRGLVSDAGAIPSEKDERKIDRIFYEMFSASFNRRMLRGPVRAAAYVYTSLVNIQPFYDGNKRAASLIMNYILMKAGYTPFILSGISDDPDKEPNAYEYLTIVSAINDDAEIDETAFRKFLRGHVHPVGMRRSEARKSAAPAKFVREVSEELNSTPQRSEVRPWTDLVGGPENAEYYEAIRQKVVERREPGKKALTLYTGSGADVSTALTTSDPDVLVMADILPFDLQPEVEVLPFKRKATKELDRKLSEYFHHKKGTTFAESRTLIDIGGIRPVLLEELKILGAEPLLGEAEIEALPVEGLANTNRMEFMWRGRKRTVYFIAEVAKAWDELQRPASEQFELYRDRLERIAIQENVLIDQSGFIDVFMLKSGEYLRGSEGLLQAVHVPAGLAEKIAADGLLKMNGHMILDIEEIRPVTPRIRSALQKLKIPGKGNYGYVSPKVKVRGFDFVSIPQEEAIVLRKRKNIKPEPEVRSETRDGDNSGKEEALLETRFFELFNSLLNADGNLNAATVLTNSEEGSRLKEESYEVSIELPVVYQPDMTRGELVYRPASDFYRRWEAADIAQVYRQGWQKINTVSRVINSPVVTKFLQSAYIISFLAHQVFYKKPANARRRAGENKAPYLIHPVNVIMGRFFEFKAFQEKGSDNPAVLAAALLHDIFEDTLITESMVEKVLGSDSESVAFTTQTLGIVNALTKHSAEFDADYFSRIIVSDVQFPGRRDLYFETILIKLIDRLDSVRSDLDLVPDRLLEAQSSTETRSERLERFRRAHDIIRYLRKNHAFIRYFVNHAFRTGDAELQQSAKYYADQFYAISSVQRERIDRIFEGEIDTSIDPETYDLVLEQGETIETWTAHRALDSYRFRVIPLGPRTVEYQEAYLQLTHQRLPLPSFLDAERNAQIRKNIFEEEGGPVKSFALVAAEAAPRQNWKKNELLGFYEYDQKKNILQGIAVRENASRTGAANIMIQHLRSSLFDNVHQTIKVPILVQQPGSEPKDGAFEVRVGDLEKAFDIRSAVTRTNANVSRGVELLEEAFGSGWMENSRPTVKALLGTFPRRRLKDINHLYAAVGTGLITPEEIRERLTGENIEVGGVFRQGNFATLHIAPAHDRPGLVEDIAEIIKNKQINLSRVNVTEEAIDLTLRFEGLTGEEMENAISAAMEEIRKIPEVKLPEMPWYRALFTVESVREYIVTVPNRVGRLYRILEILGDLDHRINVLAATSELSEDKSTAQIRLRLSLPSDMPSEHIRHALSAVAAVARPQGDGGDDSTSRSEMRPRELDPLTIRPEFGGSEGMAALSQTHVTSLLEDLSRDVLEAKRKERAPEVTADEFSRLQEESEYYLFHFDRFNGSIKTLAWYELDKGLQNYFDATDILHVPKGGEFDEDLIITINNRDGDVGENLVRLKNRLVYLLNGDELEFRLFKKMPDRERPDRGWHAYPTATEYLQNYLPSIYRRIAETVGQEIEQRRMMEARNSLSPAPIHILDLGAANAALILGDRNQRRMWPGLMTVFSNLRPIRYHALERNKNLFSELTANLKARDVEEAKNFEAKNADVMDVEDFSELLGVEPDVVILSGLLNYSVMSRSNAEQLMKRIYDSAAPGALVVVTGYTRVVLRADDFKSFGFKVLNMSIPNNMAIGNVPEQLYILRKPARSEIRSAEDLDLVQDAVDGLLPEDRLAEVKKLLEFIKGEMSRNPADNLPEEMKEVIKKQFNGVRLNLRRFEQNIEEINIYHLTPAESELYRLDDNIRYVLHIPGKNSFLAVPDDDAIYKVVLRRFEKLLYGDEVEQDYSKRADDDLLSDADWLFFGHNMDEDYERFYQKGVHPFLSKIIRREFKKMHDSRKRKLHYLGLGVMSAELELGRWSEPEKGLVLDLAKTGPLSMTLIEAEDEMAEIAMDMAEERKERLKTNDVNIQVLHRDATSIESYEELIGEKVDIVVMSGFLNSQIITREQAFAVMKNIHQSLSEKGLVLITGISAVLLNAAEFQELGFDVINMSIPKNFKKEGKLKQFYALRKSAQPSTRSETRISEITEAVSFGTLFQAGEALSIFNFLEPELKTLEALLNRRDVDPVNDTDLAAWQEKASRRLEMRLAEIKGELSTVDFASLTDVLLKEADSEDFTDFLNGAFARWISRGYITSDQISGLSNRIYGILSGVFTRASEQLALDAVALEPWFLNSVRARLNQLSDLNREPLNLVVPVQTPGLSMDVIRGLEQASEDIGEVIILFDPAVTKLTSNLKESELVFTLKTFQGIENIDKAIEKLREKPGIHETAPAFAFHEGLPQGVKINLGYDAIITDIDEIPESERGLRALIVSLGVKILKYFQPEEIRKNPDAKALLRQYLAQAGLEFVADFFNFTDGTGLEVRMAELVSELHARQESARAA